MIHAYLYDAEGKDREIDLSPSSTSLALEAPPASLAGRGRA
jgi:hypothetical protein